MSERALKARDSGRDLGAELLESVREMKAGKAGHVHDVAVSPPAKPRTRTGSREQA